MVYLQLPKKYDLLSDTLSHFHETNITSNFLIVYFLKVMIQLSIPPPDLPLLLIIMFCSSSMSQSESDFIHFCNNHHQLKQLHFASFKSSQGPEARSHHSNGSIERLFILPTASFDYSHTLRSQKEQISKPQNRIRTN